MQTRISRMLPRCSSAIVLFALIIAAPLPVSARHSSLYKGRAPRPGPDVLYGAAATSPQLENTGVWAAPPILVSGASAYRRGEFLYQDFLYDDHGASGGNDPSDPKAAGNLFSKPNGAYTYPTDPAYANDAADLVELRVKPLADATAFRLTLNTLNDPALVAFSIALGGTDGVLRDFPAGANVRAPADFFVTVHPSAAGTVADLVDAATGQPASGPAPSVTVDGVRRQIEVRVPHTAWTPSGIVRLAAGVGLWDAVQARYLLPQAVADATHPGGAAATAPTAFFNVAFRYAEPIVDPTDPAGTAAGPAWWRDKDQGTALAAGDISALHADVDFAKLAAQANDDMPGLPGGVPQAGPIDRILVSATELAPGADFSVSCFPSSTSGGTSCPGQYQGRLQPYAIYVPRKPRPSRGYGMTLLLHSLSTNYNQFLASRNQSQFGDRGGGAIVITPEARGPDGFYDGYAGADVFEVWADVARLYRLDADWTAIGGYSMGGIGTFKLAEQFPDLFARAQPTVGDSGDNNLVLSLRNIPFLMWNSAVDELVPPTSYEPTARALDNAGYRYELDVFTPTDHLALSINDQFQPAADFLGTAKVTRDPAHVTYVVDPTLDYPTLGFVADHAYWLSGLTIRDATPPLRGHAQGTIDAFSYGFRVGDPTASATQLGTGTLTGGSLPTPLVYSSQSKTWGPVPTTLKQRRLDVVARNIATTTINVRRAKVGCNADVHVDSDGPITIVLDPCARTVQAGM